jgi:hypothetical protein
VFENRVLGRISGHDWDEVTGDLRKLLDEELHNLYSLLNIIRVIKSRRMRLTGQVACMGEIRNEYILVENPDENRPLRRLRHKWEDNIKMGLREIWWEV